MTDIFKSRLHNKIFLMMVMVGMVPTIASGLWSLYSVTFSHRLSVANLENSLLNQYADAIRDFIENVLGVFQLQIADERTFLALRDQFFLTEQLLNGNHALEEVSFINLAGEETLRRNRILEQTVPQEELRSQNELEKFKIAKSGMDYVGPVYFTLSGPMVTVASPVKNKNGEIISILSGEVNLSGLQTIIKRAKLGNSGYLYVTDQNGFIIAKSDNNLTDQSLRDLDIVKGILAGKLLTGFENQLRYQSFFGSAVVAAGLYLPQFRWAIIAEWPVDEADAILMALRNQIFLFSLAAFGATVILSIFLASNIVNPIKVLESGTQLVAQGKFDQPVKIKTGDEIENLGLAFNNMIDGLKQLQQLKDEFVFIAAHELKTPVTAIRGYLSLIRDGFAGPVNKKAMDFIEKVLNANARLIRLVDDLLEVARSEAGRLQIQVTPIDIVSPINETIAELKPLADEKSIEIIYKPEAKLPKVLADSGRVREIMVNLMGNAIKYTLGKGVVTITHEVIGLSSQAGGKVVTHVKDTGMGISKEAQSKLFDKFYRVQSEQTRNITGTGLGLFIVKQIIKKMNGDIWVESEDGKGSTFSFSLPIAV